MLFNLARKTARFYVTWENILTRMTSDSSKNIIWVDLEMTGLDVEKDRIMEISSIITDGNLNRVAELGNLVINLPDSTLNSMGEWCQEQHGKSGLTEECRKSTLTLEQADEQVSKFIAEHCPKGQCPIAGNSVHVDKKFIDRYMPKVSQQLHYRIIDVSSVRELIKRWYPDEDYVQLQQGNHRAQGDIENSIHLLKAYKESFFVAKKGKK